MSEGEKQHHHGRWVVILLVLLVLSTAGSYMLLTRKATTFAQVPETLNPKAGTDVTLSVRVTPAQGRTITLQRYNRKTKKWVTKAEFRAGKGKTARVRVTLPDGWDRNVRSTWRLSASDTLTAKAAKSRRIRLTAKNIADVPGLTSKAAVVMAVDDKMVLYDRYMNRRLPNASTTKLVSAMVSMDHANGSETVTISDNVVNTKDGNLYKKKGDQFRMSDLWTAMLVMSSNDAAEAVAEGSLGSEDAFVDAMNEKVRKLGCRNTHFENPHGLDEDGHYSTAYDLALIDIAAMKYEKIPPILKIVKTEINARNTSERLNYITTTNRLMKEGYPGHLGGKTGSTDNAGNCFVGMYEYQGKRYVTCVLNSKNRWEDTVRLYTYIQKYYA